MKTILIIIFSISSFSFGEQENLSSISRNSQFVIRGEIVREKVTRFMVFQYKKSDSTFEKFSEYEMPFLFDTVLISNDGERVFLFKDLNDTLFTDGVAAMVVTIKGEVLKKWKHSELQEGIKSRLIIPRIGLDPQSKIFGKPKWSDIGGSIVIAPLPKWDELSLVSWIDPKSFEVSRSHE